MQETAKRAKERPQIWNAQKERQRAKGTGQKGIETAAKMKTAAKAASKVSAPRQNVATAKNEHAHK